MSRKAFNFFRSYYEVAKELSNSDRLAFYDALILEQFTGQKTKLKGLAKFAYLSQQHSIDSQINGYNQRLKRSDLSQSEQTNKPLIHVSIAGGEAGGEAQGKEEVEEKVQYISCFDFDSFWEMYPHKVAKQKCETKYKNISEKEREQIKLTLAKFLSYKPFESYTHPNPEAYLNQKRWQDVIPDKNQINLDPKYSMPTLKSWTKEDGTIIEMISSEWNRIKLPDGKIEFKQRVNIM